MELVLAWISRYGYFGIFSLLVLGIVGLPIPDETLLTFAGYLVFRGQLRLGPTYLAAVAGSACGITLSYSMGRLTGYFLIEKYGPKLHIKMDRVRRVHDWFRRVGGFTLTFGYFVPGVRHLTAYVAGASKLEVPTFALFAYSGSVLWTASFIALGYFLGDQWRKVPELAEAYVLIAAGALAALGAGYWVWRRRRRRRGTDGNRRPGRGSLSADGTGRPACDRRPLETIATPSACLTTRVQDSSRLRIGRFSMSVIFDKI